MKLLKVIDAHKQYIDLLDGQDGVIVRLPDEEEYNVWSLLPFKTKACVWFDDTVFYIFAQRENYDDRAIPFKDKNLSLRIHVWLKFPEKYTSEDVLRV